MRSGGEGPHDGISVIVRRGSRELSLSSPTPHPQHVRKPEGPHRNPNMLAPGTCTSPTSRTVRDKHVWFKSPRLPYAVTAAQTDRDHQGNGLCPSVPRQTSLQTWAGKLDGTQNMFKSAISSQQGAACLGVLGVF